MKKFIVAALLLMGITFLGSDTFAENEDGTYGKDVKERKLKMENRTVPFSKRPTIPNQISIPETGEDEDTVKEDENGGKTIIIRNNLNKRLIINLASGKKIDLLAKGTAEVSGDDLASSQLQALIASGDVVIE
ncbi:MAG: hypothetical protein HY097_04455 [Nitrospinae bacterium]|nr:hypothetical protein [Nitrospinota bacterium]MBI3813250.1 hypothetical protein [Nitrospinota bacterium]